MTAKVVALRRYIARKHRKTVEHARFLGRPAFPVRYRETEARR